jgi:hypothetical protein
MLTFGGFGLRRKYEERERAWSANNHLSNHDGNHRREVEALGKKPQG